MTQPPQGGYPQQPGQQGGYPQQQGFPQPGYPQQGQQHPGQYGQPQQGQHAPGYSQPGYPQQGAQPAYQPPAGGYQGQGYGQQNPYAGPGYGRPAAPKATPHWSGFAAIGAALVVFIAGFLPFYSVSTDTSGVSEQYKPYLGALESQGSGSGNAWNLWWWVPIVLAVLLAVAVGLVVFSILSTRALPPIFLFYGAVLVAVTMIGVVIHALIGPPGSGAVDSAEAQRQLDEIGLKVSNGPGWGLWLALVAALALAYFTFEYARQSKLKGGGGAQQGYAPQGYPQQGYPQQGNQQSWG